MAVEEKYLSSPFRLIINIGTPSMLQWVHFQCDIAAATRVAAAVAFIVYNDNSLVQYKTCG